MRLNSELRLRDFCIVGFFAVFPACVLHGLPYAWLRSLQIVVVRASRQELTLSGQAHAFVDQLAKLLELAGVGIIISSVLIATALFVMSGLRDRRWREAYEGYRSNLGRGILLGLELLVGADIIFTFTAPLTWQSVGLSGGYRGDPDVPELLP